MTGSPRWGRLCSSSRPATPEHRGAARATSRLVVTTVAAVGLMALTLALPAAGERKGSGPCCPSANAAGGEVPFPVWQHQLRGRQRLRRPAPGLLPDLLPARVRDDVDTRCAPQVRRPRCLGNPALNAPPSPTEARRVRGRSYACRPQTA